eukprot:1075026-Amphidinium_carterae.1
MANPHSSDATAKASNMPLQHTCSQKESLTASLTPKGTTRKIRKTRTKLIELKELTDDRELAC